MLCRTKVACSPVSSTAVAGLWFCDATNVATWLVYTVIMDVLHLMCITKATPLKLHHILTCHMCMSSLVTGKPQLACKAASVNHSVHVTHVTKSTDGSLNCKAKATHMLPTLLMLPELQFGS